MLVAPEELFAHAGKPKGVEFNAPPLAALPALTKSIEGALSVLEDDDIAVLVGVATETGVNAALVVKTGGTWNLDLITWVGKEWGAPKPSYGVAIRKRWKRR